MSDAGGCLASEGEPKRDWGRHAYRVLSIIDNQVRALRKRQLIESYYHHTRTGTYWGIRSDITKYKLPDALPCPEANTLHLANVPTRLKRLPPVVQERLINWGYAVCDAALRAHCADLFETRYNIKLTVPTRFPYPVDV